MLRAATTQVDVNTKTPLFHDEIKLRLPTVFQPQHHLLFTFLQPTLRNKGKSDNALVSLLCLHLVAEHVRLWWLAQF